MSPQQSVEMILMRQLASYLTVPIWMMDHDGNLLFYTMFMTTDLDGEPLSDIGLRSWLPSSNRSRPTAGSGPWAR